MNNAYKKLIKKDVVNQLICIFTLIIVLWFCNFVFKGFEADDTLPILFIVLTSLSFHNRTEQSKYKCFSFLRKKYFKILIYLDIIRGGLIAFAMTGVVKISQVYGAKYWFLSFINEKNNTLNISVVWIFIAYFVISLFASSICLMDTTLKSTFLTGIFESKQGNLKLIVSFIVYIALIVIISLFYHGSMDLIKDEKIEIVICMYIIFFVASIIVDLWSIRRIGKKNEF